MIHTMEWTTILTGATYILTGLGAGLTYSLTTYLKKQGQEFDIKKLLSTSIIGVLVGVVTLITGLEPSTGAAYIAQLGLIPVIENIAKIIYRKLRPLFNKK